LDAKIDPQGVNMQAILQTYRRRACAAQCSVRFRTLYDLWLEHCQPPNSTSASIRNWRLVRLGEHQRASCFPQGPRQSEGAKEIALIRLLTRLMFVWFIKEKRLVPESLFDAVALATVKEPPATKPNGHDYYLAILQNLFFATLNTGNARAAWRRDEGGHSTDYLGHHVYRHAALFAEPHRALEAFVSVPFLNGGLFECLDTEITNDDPRASHAERESKRLILRMTAFSDQPEKQPASPTLVLRRCEGRRLSGWFEKAKAPRDVPGLIDLFERYQVTSRKTRPGRRSCARSGAARQGVREPARLLQ